MRWLLDIVRKRMLNMKSVSSIAFSSSAGTFIGMLPLAGLIPFGGMISIFGIKFLIILLISLIFRLNFIFILIGVLLSIIFPVSSSLSAFLYQTISRYNIGFLGGILNLVSAAAAGIIISLVL